MHEFRDGDQIRISLAPRFVEQRFRPIGAPR
jgi:hypothetical protein